MYELSSVFVFNNENKIYLIKLHYLIDNSIFIKITIIIKRNIKTQKTEINCLCEKKFYNKNLVIWIEN